jgi:hypothetical protein
MRHHKLSEGAFEIVDVARVLQDHPAHVETVRAVTSTPSVPDMPAAAGAMLVAVYAGLMGAFALTLGDGGHAGFAIVIGVFFVTMFFAVPAIFVRFEGDLSRRPALSEFLERGIDTATGRISGAGALVQMLIVPLLLAFAILAIGVINLII